MQGVKKSSSKLGFGSAPMPEADPNATEGTCPLCGNYGALSRMGWCYDAACKKAVHDAMRQEAAESGGTVPGEYYRVGNVELINLAPWESYAEPELPDKDPAKCTCDGCEEYALVDDTLCTRHRLETNHRRYHAQRNQRQGSKRRRKGRSHKTQSIGNRIRGLEGLKLK